MLISHIIYKLVIFNNKLYIILCYINNLYRYYVFVMA